MRTSLTYYATTLIAYLLIDAVWLTLTSTPVYRATLGAMLLADFKPAPAFAVYLLQVLGLATFVLPRAAGGGGNGAAAGGGFAFGIFTYGLYDLTNLATLKHWTWGLSLTDMVWGGVVSGLASLIGWSVARRFRRQRIFVK